VGLYGGGEGGECGQDCHWGLYQNDTNEGARRTAARGPAQYESPCLMPGTGPSDFTLKINVTITVEAVITPLLMPICQDVV
jgi:hypothetical protein